MTKILGTAQLKTAIEEQELERVRRAKQRELLRAMDEQLATALALVALLNILEGVEFFGWGVLRIVVFIGIVGLLAAFSWLAACGFLAGVR